jgi:hypothetical protein
MLEQIALIMSKFCWIFLGAFIIIFLSKWEILIIDKDTNINIPVLLSILFFSIFILIKLLVFVGV